MNSKLRFYMRGLGVGLLVTTLILCAVRLSRDNSEMSDAEIKKRAAELGMVEGNSYSLIDAVTDANADNKDSATGKDSKSNTDADSKDAVEAENSDSDNGNSEVADTGSGEAQDVKDDGAESDAQATEEGDASDSTEADSDTVDSETSDSDNGNSEVTDSGSENTEDAGSGSGNTEDAGSGSGNTASDGAEDKTQQDKAQQDNKEDTIPDESANTDQNAEKATITIASGAASETAAGALLKAGLIDDATAFNSYMIRNGYDRRIHPGTYSIAVGLSYEEICKIIAG